MSDVSQFGVRIDVLSRAGNFVAALDVFEDLIACIRARPSDAVALATLEKATASLAEDAVPAGAVDVLSTLYRDCDALFSTVATNDEIGLTLALAAIGLADGLNRAGRPDDIDPIVARLRDIQLRESADRTLTIRFAHVLFAQIRAYYNAGNLDRARTMVMENRRELLAPDFLADLTARHGHDAGRKWNRLCGAMIYALAQAHTENPNWPFKTLAERFDFARIRRVALWDGAITIEIPEIWDIHLDRDEPGKIDCWAKEFDAGNLYIHHVDMFQLVDGPDLSPLADQVRGGAFDRTDFAEGHDWLVSRSVRMMRGGHRGRMVMVNLTLVTLALYDEREDFQGLVAQLEDAIGRMTIDVDRLPRTDRPI